MHWPENHCNFTVYMMCNDNKDINQSCQIMILSLPTCHYYYTHFVLFNFLKNSESIPFELATLLAFKLPGTIHKTGRNRDCDVINKAVKGEKKICDVEAKMAAPLSTMKFWKPGKFGQNEYFWGV